jgi:hypothetical protein
MHKSLARIEGSHISGATLKGGGHVHKGPPGGGTKLHPGPCRLSVQLQRPYCGVAHGTSQLTVTNWQHAQPLHILTVGPIKPLYVRGPIVARMFPKHSSRNSQTAVLGSACCHFLPPPTQLTVIPRLHRAQQRCTQKHAQSSCFLAGRHPYCYTHTHTHTIHLPIHQCKSQLLHFKCSACSTDARA